MKNAGKEEEKKEKENDYEASNWVEVGNISKED